MRETLAEDVVRSATPLFAELGYDGTTMDIVASAVGVDKGRVVGTVGGKRELYLEVMRRAHADEMAALGPVMTDFTPTGVGVGNLIDAYLDFCVAHPHVPALWMHRWLSDAADFEELEELYVRPTHDALGKLVDGLLAPGADTEFVVWTIVWSVHGFVGAQLRANHGEFDLVEVSRFRRHLHMVAWRFLRADLPEE